MAAAPHLEISESESDAENASTIGLGSPQARVVDDGLFWDINTKPALKEGWNAMGGMGSMFNFKYECNWKKLSPTQTERMQAQKGYIYLQGPSGGFFKHVLKETLTIGQTTLYKMMYKDHLVLVRSMPRGNLVGSVHMSLTANHTLYIKVHSAVAPEVIFMLHKVYACKHMTQKTLNFMVWKYMGCKG